MKCPFCEDNRDRVVDSRSSRDGAAIRRRRECLSCGHRFTTYEYVETVQTSVIKKDRRREPYNREKLKNGITIACKKRPVSIDTVNLVVDKIEKGIEAISKGEIDSLEIGNIVMNELYQLDQIAYVRFASVYRDFKSTDEFMEQLSGLDK